MFKKIEDLIAALKAKLGTIFNGHSWEINEGQIEQKLTIGQQIITAIDTILKSKTFDNILSTITNGLSDAVVTKVSAILDKVISDITIGSAIAAQVLAAPTLEAKLQVFMADMAQYGPARLQMFLNQLYADIVAGLDDNALQAEMYAFYTAAMNLIGKTAQPDPAIGTTQPEPAAPAVPAQASTEAKAEPTAQASSTVKPEPAAPAVPAQASTEAKAEPTAQDSSTVKPEPAAAPGAPVFNGHTWETPAAGTETKPESVEDRLKKLEEFVKEFKK